MALALDASGVSLTGLLAYYKFTSGALTTDSSGASQTLTNNGTITSATGLFGDAADFGSSNSTKWFSRAANLGGTLGSDGSVNFWVKIAAEPTAGNYYTFFIWHSTNGDDGNWGIEYGYTAGGDRNFYAFMNSSSMLYNSAPALGTTNWHMITATLTGGVGKFYVDGEKIAEVTGVGTQTVGNYVTIGRQEVGGVNYFSGLMDDTSFWSRALTDAEIATLYDLVPSSIILV